MFSATDLMWLEAVQYIFQGEDSRELKRVEFLLDISMVRRAMAAMEAELCIITLPPIEKKKEKRFSGFVHKQERKNS